MFHPDNIKNYHPDGGKVSVSIYNYYKKIGGKAGLAKALNTHARVNTSSFN
jgi:hypothetical protein